LAISGEQANPENPLYNDNVRIISTCFILFFFATAAVTATATATKMSLNKSVFHRVFLLFNFLFLLQLSIIN